MVGHTGTAQSYEILSCSYFWVNMRENVAQFIHNCHTFSHAKPSHKKPPGLLHPLKVHSNIWEEVSMDCVFCFPNSKSGNNSILVVIN